MRSKALVLDANVLVLLAVGLTSRTYIRAHKRLRNYTEGDFDLLLDYVERAQERVVTPNTVTEASNIASPIGDPAKTAIRRKLRNLIDETREVYVQSERAARDPSYLRLGITDAALLASAFADSELLTADLDLFIAAGRAGRNAVNFNHYLDANRR